ncbi:MAG TPA: hypothetical protein PKD64_03200 [Pirellulaceae bacterium]|nr:hypothetical protein [Pirellulaceae bacterium]HMO91177.1 hypothetical protein [Pirellulaceae bacterium]HMP69053.1 hypothetical protein [Pirellulaceae bacterium]
MLQIVQIRFRIWEAFLTRGQQAHSAGVTQQLVSCLVERTAANRMQERRDISREFGCLRCTLA